MSDFYFISYIITCEPKLEDAIIHAFKSAMIWDFSSIVK